MHGFSSHDLRASFGGRSGSARYADLMKPQLSAASGSSVKGPSGFTVRASLSSGSSKALPGLMRHCGTPVMIGPCVPRPPTPFGETAKPAIFQACFHASLVPPAFVSNVSWITGSQPSGLEFMRSVLSELKLVRDGFACLASKHQEQTQEGKDFWGLRSFESTWLAELGGLGTVVIGFKPAPP